MLCATVGAAQATEALKLILGLVESLTGHLVIYDALAVGPRLLRTVDAVAGTGLLGFAGVLGYRTLREP